MPPRTQPRQHVASTSNSTMSSICSNMEDLPLNAMVDILSRLPVKTIIHCKCVCKKWHFLVSESYFVKLHLSRSPVGLIIHHFTMQEMHNNGLGTLKLVEIEDEVDHHRLYHDPIMNFDLNRGLFSRSVKMFKKLPVGSINGLVCLTENGNESDNTYICNPVTREYMMLPRHAFFAQRNESVVFGFGVGLVTGEYKVIRTFLMHFRENPNPEASRPDLIQAEVYTLGTGKWRKLGQVPYWLDGRQAPLINGPYLNGHVHWIVRDENCPEKICAFNFDNETFKLFPSRTFDAAKEAFDQFT
ncbi:F-box associated domain containing protein [Tanacetum coccineum]